MVKTNSLRFGSLLGTAILVATLNIVGCSSRDSVPLRPFPDPLLDGLRRHHVRAIIANNPQFPRSSDTVLVFANGSNIIIDHDGRTLYDSLGYIRRLLSQTDIVINYQYDYHRLSDSILVQICKDLPHTNWEYSQKEAAPILKKVVFEIDAQGRVIKENDSIANQTAIYEYNDDGNVIKREMMNDNGEQSGYRIEYTYGSTSLSGVVEYHAGMLYSRRFFSHTALPDSIVFYDDTGARDYSIHYRYKLF